MKTISILSLLCMLLFSACASKTSKDSSHPNIIFIYADDWGYGDLGIHGSTFCETPNLDKMASEGTDFQNFSVCNPVCSPSRTAVMTGQFPSRHSVHGHFASVESHVRRGMPDWLNPDAFLLPQMLKDKGYTTGHYGKWHLTNTHVPDAPSPYEYGYDEFGCFNLSANFHQMHPDSTIPRTIDFIERHKDQPFFVNVWIHASHTPHYPKERFMKKYAHLGEQQQVYASIIAEADERIGELFAKLKELGIDDNTIVMFSSDNGPEFTGKNKIQPDNSTGEGYGTFYSVGETAGLKGQKRSLYAGGVRIPFLVRWPGVVPVRVDKSTPLATVDIMPTCAELANCTMPDSFVPDGESIVKALKNEEYTREKIIFWQWLFPSVKGEHWPSAGIQDGPWKLVMNNKINRVELYNIDQDWAEQNNLVDQEPEKVKELIAKINAWEKTLPTEAPANCVSKEREQLIKEGK